MRRWRDRKRKWNFVFCYCSLCKGIYCLVKRVSWYKNIFINSIDIDSLESLFEECILFDDVEFGSVYYVLEIFNLVVECEYEKYG